MPTGYTSILTEKDVSFKDFALRCSRAFGVLLDMRDQPLSAPIPEKLEESTYAQKALANSEREYEDLLAMSKDEQIAYSAKKRKEILASLKDGQKKSQLENNRFRDMLEKVKRWQPPTPEHQGLKDFMAEQLKTSISDDSWYVERIREVEFGDDDDYYASAVRSAKQNVLYYQKEVSKEKESVTKGNFWLNDLRKSLDKFE